MSLVWVWRMLLRALAGCVFYFQWTNRWTNGCLFESAVWRQDDGENCLSFFFSAVVKNPPNNLWIIAAVLAPIAVVTLIIIIITAVLCRKNKNDFKADAIGNLNPRAKVSVFSFCCVYVSALRIRWSWNDQSCGCLEMISWLFLYDCKLGRCDI